MARAKKVELLKPWSPGDPWQPVHTPCRFRNPLTKYRVWRNEARCIRCGKCVELCPYGVHTKAGQLLKRPKSYLCLGPACQKNSLSC